MPVDTETRNETAEAILALVDSVEKIANAFYNLAVESQEIQKKKSDALRFDIASVQPGSGFKVMVVVLLGSGAFEVKSYPVLSWVTKNVHYTVEDEVRVVPMLFRAETDEVLELRHFLSHVSGLYDYKVLGPGINELDSAELESIKADLVHRRKLQNDVLRTQHDEIVAAKARERT